MTKQYTIFDVAKDLITGNLTYASDEIADSRMQVCNSCEVQNTALKLCTACGCFLPAKVKLQESTCPMELW